MLRNAISIGLAHRNFTITMAHIFVLGLIVFPLAGCGGDEQGGPIISSLSTPTDAPSDKGAPSDSNPTAAKSTVGEDPTISFPDTFTDSTAGMAEQAAAEQSDDAIGPEYSGGEEDPMISVTSTPTGATVRLIWDPHPNPTVVGYHVYYGRQSSGEHGSCSYAESQSVEAPPATITGLEPNTPYFFAISAYGGESGESESPCSNEVLMVTPPAQG